MSQLPTVYIYSFWSYHQKLVVYHRKKNHCNSGFPYARNIKARGGGVKGSKNLIFWFFVCG